MNGMDQLSYCAARIRNTNTMASANTTVAIDPAFQFLIGDAGPFECEVAGQRDGRGPLHRRDRLPRAISGRSATVDERGRVVVVVGNGLGSHDRLEQAERAQRNHAAAGVADIEPGKICGRSARGLVRLERYAERSVE